MAYDIGQRGIQSRSRKIERRFDAVKKAAPTIEAKQNIIIGHVDGIEELLAAIRVNAHATMAVLPTKLLQAQKR